MTLKLLLLIFSVASYSWGQCNITDATDCECMEPGQTDCDLLPDIQASWYGILNYSDGPSEYPQTGAGDNNGRLRISVSTPNTGYGPLTVRGVDDNGYAYFYVTMTPSLFKQVVLLGGIIAMTLMNQLNI